MHSKKITVRFASAISAAVIGFTSTVISFFDCPVYAAYGGAAWGEFFGFYSLLEGFGFGQDNTDFINSVDNWIDSLQPEEKPREDYDGEWMTDAQYWQQCQYDKFTGWLDDLVDSWTENYDAVGDVGSGGVSGGFSFPNSSSIFSLDGAVLFSGSDSYSLDSEFFWYRPKSGVIASVFLISDGDNLPSIYIASSRSDRVSFSAGSGGVLSWRFSNGGISSDSAPVWSSDKFDQWGHVSSYSSYSDLLSSVKSFGVTHIFDSVSDAIKFLNSHTISDWQKLVFDSNSDFIGPVYTYPAAQELARQNKTSTGIRLDVKTADGTPDVKAALDGAGVSTVDELAASVAAGDVAMQDVFADAKVTPYVVADTTTGVVVTDLGVAADAAGVKPVALTKELTVPADLTTASTYAIQGKTWDPDMAKYRLPLFQYFPFCLPWDIYQVLSSFAADPVAPQIEIPIGKFFANKKSFDGSAVANYTETLNLGDEKFSKWFSALRLLESAGIIIGLVLISVHLIHGGR